MATEKWRDVAYACVQGKGEDKTDNVDVEANVQELFTNATPNKKADTGSTGVEEITMQSLHNNSLGTPCTQPQETGGSSNTAENQGLNQNHSSPDVRIPMNDLNQRNTLVNKDYRNAEIHNFARKGDVQQCLRLMNNPDIHVDVRGANAMTPLHFAAKNGHEDLVRELLNQGADRLLEDLDQSLPLHHAGSQGYLECVKLLLGEDRDQQLNYRTKKGRTPLMESSDSGCQDCCKLLIGANIDEVDNQKNTALHLAVKGGYIMIVKFLVDNHADPTKSDKIGVTPLHTAANHNDTECLKILISAAQQNILQVDEKGKSILHHAVSQKEGTSMEYLLETGFVDGIINESYGSRGTPLIYAIECRNYDCVDLLLDKNASIHSKCNGSYPFLKAAEHGLNLVCEKMLVLDRDIVKQMDDAGQTALHLAARRNFIETVDLLCIKIGQAKISPSATNKAKQTALHVAISKKAQESVIRRLISANISVVKQDSKGLTALHLAAALGKTRICGLLINKGRSILYKYCDAGFSPLDSAFQFMEKNEETIQFLLKVYTEEDSKRKTLVDINQLVLVKSRMKKYMEKAIEKNLHVTIVAIMDSVYWEEALFRHRSQDPDNFKMLLKVFPDLALKVQGKCITSSTRDETIYSFKPYVETYFMEDGSYPFNENTWKLNDRAQERHEDVYSWVNNHCVNHMIANNECEMLKHPVTLAWLRQKWKSYIRYIHFSVLAIEAIYLSSVVCLMATTWNWVHISQKYGVNKTEFCEAADALYPSLEATSDAPLKELNATKIVKEFEERVNPYRGFYHWVFVTWIVKVALEIYYAVRLKLRYLSYEMVSYLVIEISQLILTMIVLFAPFGMCYTGRIGLLQEDLVWGCGVFSVLCAWLHLVNSVNHAMTTVFLPITQDFLEILIKVLYFLITFIVIFAFIFHLLLLDQQSFASVPQSICSTLVWMLTDLGYKDFFVEVELAFPILSNIVFFVFITTIGCVILSVINKERTVKSRGKDLDHDYRRLVIYIRLIFRYDICFPQFRRWFAVDTYKINRHNQTLLEYYLGEIENAEAQAETSQDNKEIIDRINNLETVVTEINDHVAAIKLQLSKLTNSQMKCDGENCSIANRVRHRK